MSPGVARNKGIKIAQSNHLLFLDIDDKVIIKNFSKLIFFISRKNFSFMHLNRENKLSKKNANHILLDPLKVKDLIIYGAGNIAGQIISKTAFFQKIENYDLVDGNKQKIGQKLFDKKIMSPSIIKTDNRSVFIATAQHYDDVYKNILTLKGSDKNIISGLII